MLKPTARDCSPAAPSSALACTMCSSSPWAGTANPATRIAKFVSQLGEQVEALFAQVLVTCNAQGLIGGELCAIDGVKLPSHASKECSSTHEELRQRAVRLERAAERIVSMHLGRDRSGSDGNLDEHRQKRVETARTR
ncbi:hypothetical protein [Pseudomonas aeruginosa]|uniref:hypothetical protein n=1 Tax=Pseudomonas aeruginosa TaxID=287 RepID=UPI003CC61EAA